MTSRRNLMAVLVLILTFLASAKNVQATPPNVVFILADDLGYTDLGCYGSSFYETPELDAFAQTAMKFTRAYAACPVCSPTRASIMTGKVPPRVGITDYLPGLTPDSERLLSNQDFNELPLSEVTIAEALQSHGYETFFTGKWHLGDETTPPGTQGFQTVHMFDKEAKKNKDYRVHSSRMVTDFSIDFLNSHDKDKPFFLYLAFHDPHTPIVEHPESIDHFKAKAAALPADIIETKQEHTVNSRVVQNRPDYASTIKVVDISVGRILRTLTDLKLDDNTIVIFFSDNGGLCTIRTGGPTSNAPLRSGKGWLYEGGVREPLLVRVPGLTKPGSTCQTPVLSTDFYPTLLELCGVPAMPAQHVDGMSFVDLLSGKPRTVGRTLCWHYPHYHGSSWEPGASILDGDWKLIEFYDDDVVELYNLHDDPSESVDLSASKPELTAQLIKKLRTWQNQTGAQMPRLNPKYKAK